MYAALAIVLALGALGGLWCSLLADRARGRRRCPWCWHDLSGLTGGAGAGSDAPGGDAPGGACDGAAGAWPACPECGRVVRDPRDWARTRRRRGVAACCAAGLALAAAAWQVPEARRHGWISAAPTWGLLAVAETTPTVLDERTGWWRELLRRQQAGGMSGAAERVMVNAWLRGRVRVPAAWPADEPVPVMIDGGAWPLGGPGGGVTWVRVGVEDGPGGAGGTRGTDDAREESFADGSAAPGPAWSAAWGREHAGTRVRVKVRVDVEVRRAGGAGGGGEARTASWVLTRPVRIVGRAEELIATDDGAALTALVRAAVRPALMQVPGTDTVVATMGLEPAAWAALRAGAGPGPGRGGEADGTRVVVRLEVLRDGAVVSASEAFDLVSLSGVEGGRGGALEAAWARAVAARAMRGDARGALAGARAVYAAARTREASGAVEGDSAAGTSGAGLGGGWRARVRGDAAGALLASGPARAWTGEVEIDVGSLVAGSARRSPGVRGAAEGRGR